MGVALLMYPTVFSSAATLTRIPERAVFFGFCGLVALVVGYFVDRQVIISHLRAQLDFERHHLEELRREASTDLLTMLPRIDTFCDRLVMEHRRASSTQQPLSLLAVELKPSRVFAESGEVETAFGDAAKTLLVKLRSIDSIFMVAPGIFGILLPAVNANDAYILRDRLIDGLNDAAGTSHRFSFTISLVNFPVHVATAREMEESIRSLLPHDVSANSGLELLTPVLAHQ
jgi:GGDEF domain-containing protein